MNKLFLKLLTCFLLGSIGFLTAQKKDKDQRSAFLPYNIGKGVNTEYDEFNPVLSPDGQTLYFTRANHPKNYYGIHDSQDIWYSELQSDRTWGEAKHFDNFINGARYNAVLSVSNDGKKLLVSGAYKKNKKWYGHGLSIVSKFGDEWGTPELIKMPSLNRLSEGNFNAYLSYDGSYLIMAITKRFDGKKLNLYVSKNEDGEWQKPINLGKNINTKKFSEEAPFLANDNEVLYFSSNQKDGMTNFDIYKSSRMSASWTEWTTPQRLSDTINSPGYESYFKTNGKGTYAYFASTTNSTGGSSDIFKVKLKEEYPFIVLYGKILNKKTGEPMLAKKDYTITVNDLKADSLTINYDSATYRLKLPFAKKYVLKPIVKNYTTIADTFDAREIKEYLEIPKNLYVEPIPYALVKGTFIDKNTGLTIPPGATPKLVVNGVVSDSAKIELSTASYIVKLPYGKSYTMSVQAFKYIPVMDSLDLTKITEYQEVTKPLYAEKEKIVFTPTNAIITGKVYDKKTGKLIASTVPFNVVVDSLPDLSASINAAASEYTIEVPPGRVYTLGGKAEGYYAVFEKIDLRKEKGNVKIIKDLTLAPIIVGQAIRLNNIFFVSGKAQLTPASFPELDKLAKFLVENPTVKVEIAGHTDNVGKPDKNLQLSRWRARACELYIESKGVNPDQVSFNGYGSTKPVASNKTPWGKSQNRRVEFVIKSVK